MADEDQAHDGDALLGPHILHIRPGHELDRRVSAGASTRLLAGKVATDCQALLELLPPQADYLVLVVVRGRIVCRHGDAYLEADSGSLLAAAPHQRLKIEFGPDCLVRLVRIKRRFMEGRLAPLLALPPESVVSFAPTVTSLRGLNDTVTKSLLRFLTGAPRARLTRGAEEIFVDWLLRHHPHTCSGLPRDGAMRNGALVAFVKVLMDADPFGGRQMGYYARRAGVTLAELTAAFQESGCLPHEYLRGVRLDCVRRLLLSGNLSVRAAAEECGFRDNAEFTKWYFHRFGEWPWMTRRHGRSE
jgi:AraC-like DNA-binding protein